MLNRRRNRKRESEGAAVEPFALSLYWRFLNGESVHHLSAESGISADRIEQRLRAAALFRGRQQENSGPAVLMPGKSTNAGVS